MRTILTDTQTYIYIDTQKNTQAHGYRRNLVDLPNKINKYDQFGL